MSYIKRIELADKLVLFICKLLKINRKHLCFQVLSNFSDKNLQKEWNNSILNKQTVNFIRYYFLLPKFTERNI